MPSGTIGPPDSRPVTSTSPQRSVARSRTIIVANVHFERSRNLPRAGEILRSSRALWLGGEDSNPQ